MKFIEFQIEIFDLAEKQKFDSLGIEKDAQCEIVPLFIEVSQIESVRKSYLGNKEAVTIGLKSGDSYCVLGKLSEILKYINETN